MQTEKMTSVLKSKYVGIGCGLNNSNSSVDGIGIENQVLIE